MVKTVRDAVAASMNHIFDTINDNLLSILVSYSNDISSDRAKYFTSASKIAYMSIYDL